MRFGNRSSITQVPLWVTVAPLLVFHCFALHKARANLRTATVSQIKNAVHDQVLALDHSWVPKLVTPVPEIEAFSSNTAPCSPEQKKTEVIFDHETFGDSPVCKQFNLKYDRGDELLHLAYDAATRTLCIAGSDAGYQSRHAKTCWMIRDAMKRLDADCKALSGFRHHTIFTGDMSNCSDDMAYAAETISQKECKTKLIPDHTFYHWIEAGLTADNSTHMPEYTTLNAELVELGSHPASERRCGWAGNPGTNGLRGMFRDKANKTLFDVVTPTEDVGPAGIGGRISMQDQVRRWACLVDLPGIGFSGRLPYLLHSGRPLLLVERGPGQSTDPVWYSHLLKPWVHYIPVRFDLTDLTEKAEFALGLTPGSNATEIGTKAREFAENHLSYEAAIKYLGDRLVEISKTPDHPPFVRSQRRR